MPKAVQRRLANHIDAFAQKPRPAGVKKLKGSDDLYRLQVGDYRILYQIKDTILLILIIRVAHRKEAYR
ncbi:MAG: type II toxin-antitoxin system RelE/ParE family toxin [Gammaproteobacteria bacterium]|nr:type II toxin-antitoxin system RelE/ParE family toxin [Gammaproteobacteria bacterium]